MPVHHLPALPGRPAHGPRAGATTVVRIRFRSLVAKFWLRRALGGLGPSEAPVGRGYGVWTTAAPATRAMHTFSRGPMARKTMSRQRYSRPGQPLDASFLAPAWVSPGLVPRPVTAGVPVTRALRRAVCGAHSPAYAAIRVVGRFGAAALLCSEGELVFDLHPSGRRLSFKGGAKLSDFAATAARVEPVLW